MFIVGDRYFGKVDRVPGCFHVATRFLHVWWIPLVPRESYLILENTDERRGVRIPLCRKSVIKGYVLGYSMMLAVLGIAVPIMLYFEKGGLRNQHEIKALAFLSIIGLIAFGFSCWFARTPRPDKRRAEELGTLAGFDPQLIADAIARSRIS
jgi:hypothetical protein